MSQRFGRVWQITAIPWLKGTVEQRQAVRDTFTPIFDSCFDRLLYRLDLAVNQAGRHYLTVELHSSGNTVPGVSGPAGISIATGPGVSLKAIQEVARHEFGHMTDHYNLLTATDRLWFIAQMGRETWPGAWESWAEAVREWVESDGQVWQALTPILLPT